MENYLMPDSVYKTLTLITFAVGYSGIIFFSKRKSYFAGFAALVIIFLTIIFSSAEKSSSLIYIVK